MDAEPAALTRPMAARPGDRVAAAFLIALMTVGAFALWLGIPLACLLASSRLAGSSAEHFLLDLPMTIGAMIVWGMFLVWLNALYLRVTGVIARYRAEEAEFGPGAAQRFLRGPLEPILVGSLVVALVALAVWFLFLAHAIDPGSSVAP